MRPRNLLAAVALLSAFAAAAVAQQPQFYGWVQPSKQARVFYPTPLRDLLFGKSRTVPTGPPVPYYLVPGKLVPPTVIWPEVPEPKQ